MHKAPLFTLLLLFGFGLFAQTPDAPMTDSTYYDKAWSKIDQFMAKKRSQDAYKAIDELIDKARADKQDVQIIKGLLHKMSLNGFLKEKSDSINLALIQAETERSDFPTKNILATITGQMYYQYYRQNRWRIANRTAVDIKPDDFTTWDIATIMEAAGKHYLAALENAEKLQAIPIEDFRPLLTEGRESARYRPTLYDLLAHRALNFFKSSETSLSEPAHVFELTNEQAFLPTKNFVNLTFVPQDLMSRDFQGTRILQELLRFHLKGDNTYALVDAELARLDFAQSHAVGDDSDTLYLRSLEALHAQHKDHPVSTLVTARIAEQYSNRAGNYNAIASDKYKWDYQQANDLCKEAIKKFPDSEGAKLCQNIQLGLLSRSLEVTLEEVNVPDQPFRMYVRYRNLAKLHARVIQRTEALDAQLIKMQYSDQEQLAEILRKQPVVEAWSIDLPEDPDFHTHAVEVAVPALPLGEYIVLVADHSEFLVKNQAIAYARTAVSGISFFAQQIDDQGATLQVRDRESGKPLKGVLIQPYKFEYDQKEWIRFADAQTTNKQGEAKVFIDRYQRDVSLHFTYKDDSYRAEYRGGGYYYGNDPGLGIQVTKFFLDRTIYRPGQTIYFKGIVLNKDGDTHSISPNTKHTVNLYDANYQEVQKLELTTNEYGTFTGSFVAPTSGLLGNMHLQTDNGDIYFRVEEYKRPKFEVTFEPLKGSFALNDEVKAQGIAKAYAGSVIDGAEVRYRVVREASFPYWGYFRWWQPLPSSPQREIASGTLTTDKEGKFEVPFTLIPDNSLDKDDNPIFTYTVYADVVDISGETRSSQTRIRAGYISLEVKMDVPEALTQGALRNITLNTTNLAGEFEAAIGEVSIYPLQAPKNVLRHRKWPQPDKHLMSEKAYKNLFPNDVYKNEHDKRAWPKGEAVLETKVNTGESKEVGLEVLENADPGTYAIEFTTADKDGNEIKLLEYVTLSAKKAKRPAVPQLLEVVHVASKSHYEPGETATLRLTTSAKRLYVKYQLVQGREVLKEALLKVKGGKALTVEVPIKETHRGGISYTFAYISLNEFHDQAGPIGVPWTNKQLSLSWGTFRSKLRPGAEEEWQLKIAGSKGEAVAAELVAAMYDASLDAFSRPNSFGLWLNPNYSRQLSYMSQYGFGTERAQLISDEWNPHYRSVETHSYDQLNLFGFGGGMYNRRSRSAPYFSRSAEPVEERSRMAMPLEESVNLGFMDKSSGDFDEPDAPEGMPVDAHGVTLDSDQDGIPDRDDPFDDPVSEPDPNAEVSIRTNLNETAFFFPQLQTDKAGHVLLNFTMPEALTRWRFLGLAHTKDLKTGTINAEVVTQKELMVMPHLPRFLRQGDKIALTAKVSNLSEQALDGSAELILLDAMTMQPIGEKFGLGNASQVFRAEAGQSAALSWDLTVPDNVQAVVTQVVARAGEFSDGEENVLPILTNRMLVTESLPLPVSGIGTKEFTFDKLLAAQQSSTLVHQRLTLEFTSNPAWYAVQALPYLIEYPHECSEQIFSRFYANALASHIATSSPKIQRVFEQWRSQAESDVDARGALLSNLENNQELKSVLLEETPWLLNANSESERKQRVGLLFDLNRMADELGRAKDKLAKLQTGEGGFAWFPGMRPSPYITNIIVTGMGHLTKLGVGTATGDPEVLSMVTKALPYLDRELQKDYAQLKRYYKGDDLQKQHIGYSQIQYLYMRSFYPDIALAKGTQEAYDYYYGQAKKFWPDQSRYMQGMISLVLHRHTDHAVSEEVLEGLRQNAIVHPELGMYWKQGNGYYWYQAPIEQQSLLVEAFHEVENDVKSVEAMKIWLLKNKQTNDWKTTRATVAACNALLMTGTDLLEADRQVAVSLGGEVIDPYKRHDAKVEAGTGYYKTAWLREEIKPEMGKVTVEKKEDGVAWGALYWQYFEDLDKITYAETPLKIQKALFVEEITEKGPKLVAIADRKLEPGDKVVVRIELRVDRDMEYVHMKDHRASGFEPINVLSQYKYQDGLGYYESTKDAATHFFFSRLRGNQTYVFEYPLRVSHEGDFSNGVTTVQCMYAPEFTSHSEGLRVTVE